MSKCPKYPRKKRHRDIEQAKLSLSRSRHSERGRKAARYYECDECQG